MPKSGTNNQETTVTKSTSTPGEEFSHSLADYPLHLVHKSFSFFKTPNGKITLLAVTGGGGGLLLNKSLHGNLNNSLPLKQSAEFTYQQITKDLSNVLCCSTGLALEIMAFIMLIILLWPKAISKNPAPLKDPTPTITFPEQEQFYQESFRFPENTNPSSQG